MQGVKYFIAITQREYTEQYLDFLRNAGNAVVFTKLTNGTATDGTLNCLGLEKTEKIMFEGLVREENVPALKKGLINELDISSAGNGIAFFMPVDGIGGGTAKKYLIGEAPVIKREEEEENMEERSKLVLIIIVADKGTTDLVMDAARGAGASAAVHRCASGMSEAGKMLSRGSASSPECAASSPHQRRTDLYALAVCTLF